MFFAAALPLLGAPVPHYDPERPWKRRAIKNGGGNKHHDQFVGDFDGDGKEELVFWNQGKAARKLWLARVPADPKTAEAWPLTEIRSVAHASACGIDTLQKPLSGLRVNYLKAKLLRSSCDRICCSRYLAS